MARVYLYPKNTNSAILKEGPGLGSLTPIFATVNEELLIDRLPGLYLANVRFPINDILVNDIEIGCYLKMSTPHGLDFFKIIKTNKTVDYIDIEAWHVSYILRSHFINKKTWTDEKLSDIWSEILSSDSNYDFEGESDITDKASLEVVRKNTLEIIVGTRDEESVINKWGGELERRGYKLNMKKRIGSDRDVVIKYGRNITGVNYTIDNSETFHAIIPTYNYTKKIESGTGGTRTEDKLRVLPIQKCPGYNNIDQPITIGHHFSEVKIGYIKGEGEDEYIETSEIDADNYVLSLVDRFWVEGRHIPTVTASIRFVDMRRTEDYKRAFRKTLKMTIRNILKELKGIKLEELLIAVGHLTIKEILTQEWVSGVLAQRIQDLLGVFGNDTIEMILLQIGHLSISEILAGGWTSELTEEESLLWKNLAEYEKLYIGDTVRAYWEGHFDIRQRVVSYKWDAGRELYTEIILGKAESGVYEAIRKTK